MPRIRLDHDTEYLEKVRFLMMEWLTSFTLGNGDNIEKANTRW